MMPTWTRCLTVWTRWRAFLGRLAPVVTTGIAVLLGLLVLSVPLALQANPVLLDREGPRVRLAPRVNLARRASAARRATPGRRQRTSGTAQSCGFASRMESGGSSPICRALPDAGVVADRSLSSADRQSRWGRRLLMTRLLGLCGSIRDEQST